MNFKGLKYNIGKYFFVKNEMQYLGLWVTRDGIKSIEKNTSNKKYEATDFLKRSTLVYRSIELLPRYVVYTPTCISAFN